MAHTVLVAQRSHGNRFEEPYHQKIASEMLAYVQNYVTNMAPSDFVTARIEHDNIWTYIYVDIEEDCPDFLGQLFHIGLQAGKHQGYGKL